MKKKIKLALEKTKEKKIIRGNIIIPTQFSKSLGWYDIEENLNVEYKDEKIIISKKKEGITEEQIKKENNGVIIFYFGNTKIRRTKKITNEKKYLTEKIMLPIEIARQISGNFLKLELIVELAENKIIIERG